MDAPTAGFNPDQTNLSSWTLALHFQGGSHLAHNWKSQLNRLCKDKPQEEIIFFFIQYSREHLATF